MGAVGMLARVRLARHWRSVVVVGLLIAIAGGAVLTCIAGARRTRSALDRLGSRTRVANAAIQQFDGPDPAFTARVRTLPGVRAIGASEVWAAGLVQDRRGGIPVVATVDGDFGRVIDRTILVAGRRARGAHEIVLPSNVAGRLHLKVGAQVRIATYSDDQLDALQSGQDVPPHGPTIPLRVVGIDRGVRDLTTQGEKTGIVFVGQAVWRAYQARVLAFAGLLRVRLAPGSSRAFTAAFHRMARGTNATFDTGGLDTAGVDDSLGVLAVGLTLFAVLGALGALATLLVLLGRWAASARGDQPVEHALGQRPRERALAVALPMLPAVVGGSLAAVGLAVLGSRWMPIGAARTIEPDPGVAVDAPVLAIGLAALVVVTAAATLVTAWWHTRRDAWAPGRPARSESTTRLLAAVTGWRLPVPAVIGSRMALDRGRGSTAVPGRAAVIAAALGITGIVAAIVVAASMDRVRTDPDQYTYGYDAIVEGFGGLVHPVGNPACAPVRTPAAELTAVAAAANYCQGSVSIDGGRSVTASALGHIRGTIHPVVLRGRAPRGAHEMLVGEKTLAHLDRSIGAAVDVRGDSGHARMRIVGTTFFPPPNSHDTVTFADGALLPAATLAKLEPGDFPQVVLRWRPGADVTSAEARIRTISGAPVTEPVRPPEIDRLLQVDDLPVILAGFLALLAVVGVGHSVVTNATRRRRDLALLETLGFRTRQVTGTIASHAVTIAILGLVVGIPVGILVGRLAWRAVAHGVGIDPAADVPALLVLATVPAALVVVLLMSVYPARRVARIRPAVALRSE
jgi:hypothetical protein